jgi:hypothetical protein
LKIDGIKIKRSGDNDIVKLYQLLCAAMALAVAGIPVSKINEISLLILAIIIIIDGHRLIT